MVCHEYPVTQTSLALLFRAIRSQQRVLRHSLRTITCSEMQLVMPCSSKISFVIGKVVTQIVTSKPKQRGTRWVTTGTPVLVFACHELLGTNHTQHTPVCLQTKNWTWGTAAIHNANPKGLSDNAENTNTSGPGESIQSKVQLYDFWTRTNALEENATPRGWQNCDTPVTGPSMKVQCTSVVEMYNYFGCNRRESTLGSSITFSQWKYVTV